MKKKIIIWGIIVIAFVAILVSAGTFNNKTSSAKPTILIGATLPLTGPVAVLGQSSQKAILLAEESLNKTSTKYTYKVVFDDDGFSPTKAATVANKLISVDKVDVLFSFGSPVGNAVSPIAEAQKIPHVNFFASDSNVANGDYNFLHYTPPYVDAKLFVKELNKRGIKKLVFFEIQGNAGATAIMQAFEKEIVGTDIKVLANKKFTAGTRDFRTLISEVKDLHPDIYVLQSSSPEIETVYKQLREMGVKEPVTSVETFEFADDLTPFNGSWYINSADAQKWFVDSYTNRYKEAPKFGAANAYDGLNIIVKAVESAGDGKTIPTKDQIKDAIKNIKSFDGALGQGLKFDDNGQLISGAVVRMIQDGKPVTVGE